MSTGVGERAWVVVVPHHARGASLARHRLAADLTRGLALAPGLLDDALAVVSELVGNAVRHARPLPGGVVRVAWAVRPDALELRVTDGGSAQHPRVCAVGAEAISGRGLAIVAALAARWGVTRDGLSQSVWAELIY